MNPNAELAHQASSTTGILLLNLGTPSAPTAPAIRRYLRQFLSDRRVIDLNPLLWQAILNLFVLPLRPQRLAPAYASIWTSQGSPLLVETRAIGAGVQRRLREEFGDSIQVAVGMRYGEPSVASALDELHAAGARRLVVLPLYPQYCSSSTATAFDAVWQWMARARWVPAVRTIDSYHDNTAYIAALAGSVESFWRENGRSGHLLISFHGMPQRYLLDGDPYYCHCQKTARLLAQKLGLRNEEWSVSFQSRFGREPWVKPATDEWLPKLARQGALAVDVICPGFAADCLETLEEVALRYRALFESTVEGARLRYIPALNGGEAHIVALCTLLASQLKDFHIAAEAPEDTEARLNRATKLEPVFFGK